MQEKDAAFEKVPTEKYLIFSGEVVRNSVTKAWE